MTLQQLFILLKTSGYPVAYREFKSPPQIPFIAYMEESRENIGADDSFYIKRKKIRIELYTENKNETAEQTIETILENNEILYTFTEIGLIENENLFEVVYEIQI